MDRLDECRADVLIRKPLSNEQADWLVSEVECLRAELAAVSSDRYTIECERDELLYRLEAKQRRIEELEAKNG